MATPTRMKTETEKKKENAPDSDIGSTSRTGARPAEVTDRIGEPAPETGPEHEKIAALAYGYWQERGCPDGCPEEDWFRAEQELRRHGISP